MYFMAQSNEERLFAFLFSNCFRIGRKPVFFISLVVYLVPRLISFFLPHHFWTFAFFMFLSGTGFPLSYLIPGMLIAELSDDEYRSFAASVGWVVWVTGM
jgi:MFS family permease